jgi:hypothetical protein
LEGSGHGLIKVLSWYFLGGPDENHEKLGQYSQCPGQAPSKYKCRGLPQDQPVWEYLEYPDMVIPVNLNAGLTLQRRGLCTARQRCLPHVAKVCALHGSVALSFSSYF